MFFTVHCTACKHSAAVHQMQYYIPAPQPPNKTLWCQIDTLVNSSSWIWYCLATAENPLLVASSGRGEDGSDYGSGVRRGRGMMVDGINHNGALWCRSLFGLPPGSGAKLKPRKSDYGVPGGLRCPVTSWWVLIYSLLYSAQRALLLAGRPIC